MPAAPAAVKALFLEAAAIDDPVARAALLNERCREDAALLARVNALLVANDRAVAHERTASFGGADGGDAAEPTADFPGKDEHVGAILAGKYKLIEKIGEGGMGSVYMAQQTEPVKRAVAVKVIKAGMDSKAVLARFEAERQALAMMDHPNIARVLDAGTTDGSRPFFVMELVKGTPITQFCDERKLTPRQRLELFVPVCQAIQHAHQKGIIHRDIKPTNVFVAMYDDRPVPKVIDFGVAKAAGQSLTDKTLMTGFGAVVGTPEYMSPEQANLNNLDIDTRSDVYSLGVLLYELLTGSTPVDRKSLGKAALLEILRIVREVEAPRPSAKLSTIDTLPSVAANRGTEPAKLSKLMKGELDWVLLKALEKDRTRRYETANALSRDIQRYLADEVVEARPPSTGYRLKKFVRRHKGQVIAASLVLLALLGGIAGTTWGLFRAENRRVEAEQARAAEAARVTERDIAEAQRRAAADEARNEAQQRRAAEEARYEAQRKGKAERWERYRSNIAVATQALQLQNSGSARSALEAAPPEHRNWEWQYFHSQLDGARLVLPVPGGRILSFVPSPSGRQVAVCCFGHNEVYLYDVATGRLEAVFRGHSAPATSVAYRPDGKQVATVSNDQTIRLWDPATGQQMALLKAEVAPPNLDRNPLVAYNSDGSRIASFARENGAGTTRLWDAGTGKEIAVLGKWQEGIRPVAFSPDGKRVAAGAREHVYLCDAVTGRQLAVLGPHAKTVERLAYSPDGKRIAYTTAEGPNAIHLWDGESGKEVAVLRGHTAFVSSVLFSPDGSRLISGSQYPDTAARLWDAATGRLLTVLAGHKNAINTVAFSPDGKRVATASSDQTARLWDGRTGQFLTALGGHTGPVKHVLFSPNGTRVVTASDDATLRLWGAQTGELIGVLRGHGDGFNCAPVFTPDGSRLVSGSTDGTVRVWDMGLVERNGILRGHESYVFDVAFSPDGEQVASAAWDGTARLWDATTGRQTGLLRHATAIINSVTYSRDGRRLATMERERGVTLWDVASQKAARAWRKPSAGFDPRASLNPAETLLAAGSAEGPVRLWDVATGREVARLEGHDKGSIDVAFHPDGSLLASAGLDGTVRLWDVATQVPVAVLRGHTDSVWRVAFSADGQLLASASSDKTIRLWDAQTHEQLAVIPLGSVVYGVAFSPDGTRLAAGCGDNTVRLIDVASRQQVAELRGHTDYVHAVAWGPDGTRLVSGSGDITVRIWDSLSPVARARAEGAHGPGR